MSISSPMDLAFAPGASPASAAGSVRLARPGRLRMLLRAAHGLVAASRPLAAAGSRGRGIPLALEGVPLEALVRLLASTPTGRDLPDLGAGDDTPASMLQHGALEATVVDGLPAWRECPLPDMHRPALTASATPHGVVVLVTSPRRSVEVRIDRGRCAVTGRLDGVRLPTPSVEIGVLRFALAAEACRVAAEGGV